MQECIDLKNPAVHGATWRHAVGGWGLTRLQLDFRGPGLVECRIAVNSAERAHAWGQANDPWGEPARWDQAGIEKHTRRLIRVVLKCA